MKVSEAKKINNLSDNSKMSGYSWGTSPFRCNIGQELAKIPGSVCSGCFGHTGNYCKYKATLEICWDKRLNASLKNDLWVEAMTLLVGKDKSGYFRWFDVGDIANLEQLKNIMQVTRNTPHIKHWLPTKERRIVKEYLKTNTSPDNVLIRFSANFVDKKAQTDWPWTANVHKDQEPIGQVCKSPEQGNKCQDCRACWNKNVPAVSYKLH